MTSAYDLKRDVRKFRDKENRGLDPYRYAKIADIELDAYGLLWASNSHATATQSTLGR